MINLKGLGWGWYLGRTWVIEISKSWRDDASKELLILVSRNTHVEKMWNEQQIPSYIFIHGTQNTKHVHRSIDKDFKVFTNTTLILRFHNVYKNIIECPSQR